MKNAYTEEDSDNYPRYVSHVILIEHPRCGLRHLHSTDKCLGDGSIRTRKQGHIHEQAGAVEVWTYALVVPLIIPRRVVLFAPREFDLFVVVILSSSDIR